MPKTEITLLEHNMQMCFLAVCGTMKGRKGLNLWKVVIIISKSYKWNSDMELWNYLSYFWVIYESLKIAREMVFSLWQWYCFYAPKWKLQRRTIEEQLEQVRLWVIGIWVEILISLQVSQGTWKYPWLLITESEFSCLLLLSWEAGLLYSTGIVLTV